MKGKLVKLEMMRGFAALYVFAGHLAHHFSLGFGPRVNKLIAESLRFGQEAVMLFFLISGFVIFYSTEKKHPDFATYFGHRWKRIYPIFLISLALISVDILLLKSKPFPWHDFWGNLLMLQDISSKNPGVWFPTFGDNLPLWSLAYEWWFYFLFYPIWRLVPTGWQRIIAASISLLGLIGFAIHPNQPCLYLTYFILWWTGAELARQYVLEGRVTFKMQRTTIAVLGGFVGLTAGILLFAHHYNHWKSSWPRSEEYPYLEIRHFMICWIIVVGALTWQKFKWIGFNSIFGIFKYVAPVSYGIYALHYPIAITGSFFSFIPWEWVKLFAVIVASFAAAWFAEVPFQKFVNRWSRFLPNRTFRISGEIIQNNQSPASQNSH